MSDEDDVDDIDPEQDEVEREEDDKEIEEWDDYRKEGEEVSEEVRAWRGGGSWGSGLEGDCKGIPVLPTSFSGCPPPSRRS